MGQKKIKFIGETDTKKGSKSKKGKEKTDQIKSGKSGEARLTDMGQKALEEMEKVQKKEEKEEGKAVKTAKKSIKKQKAHSKRYQSIKKAIDPLKTYTAKAALQLIEKNKLSSFDESVEVHIVAKEKLSTSVSLPHGTGKKQKIEIADEKLITDISEGKIDFDILIAEPAMMPKLAKVAKILGPKGLMPNPKTNTISDKPEELKKKLEAGSTRFKTEAKNPLIHFTIGKVSFGTKKLEENLEALIKAIKTKNIEKISLCSTMGPGIKTQPVLNNRKMIP